VLRAKQIAIVANGSMEDYSRFKPMLEEADFIIGVDGGLKHLEKMGLVPDVMMGDFDSIESLEFYKGIYPNAEIETFEARKDYTDSELAIHKAIALGAEEVNLFGVTGNRLDHTLANISLLKNLYDSDVKASIVNEDNRIYYTESSLVIRSDVGTNMSIIPLSLEVGGIYIEGFEYPLVDATLSFGSTRGISNVFSAETARICISSGRIVVMQSRD